MQCNSTNGQFLVCIINSVRWPSPNVVFFHTTMFTTIRQKSAVQITTVTVQQSHISRSTKSFCAIEPFWGRPWLLESGTPYLICFITYALVPARVYIANAQAIPCPYQQWWGDDHHRIQYPVCAEISRSTTALLYRTMQRSNISTDIPQLLCSRALLR